MISEDSIGLGNRVDENGGVLQSFFDDLSRDWEQKYTSGVYAARLAAMRKVTEGLPLSGQHWLDAGCGTGHIARWLAKECGCHVLGFDQSSAMLAQAHPFPGCRYMQGSVTSIPAEIGIADGALCLSVLEYLDDPETAVSQLAAHIRPGGHLIVSVLHLHWAHLLKAVAAQTRHLLRQGKLLPHHRRFTRARFEKMLARHGFETEMAFDFMPFEFPLPGARQSVPFVPGSLLMFRARRV